MCKLVLCLSCYYGSRIRRPAGQGQERTDPLSLLSYFTISCISSGQRTYWPGDDFSIRCWLHIWTERFPIWLSTRRKVRNERIIDDINAENEERQRVWTSLNHHCKKSYFSFVKSTFSILPTTSTFVQSSSKTIRSKMWIILFANAMLQTKTIILLCTKSPCTFYKCEILFFAVHFKISSSQKCDFQLNHTADLHF